MGTDIHGFIEVEREEGWEALCEIPTGRNYDLFGVLAGVRNYVNTKPISEPKGIPDDASSTTEKSLERWRLDAHSHSYLTIKEILDHDWDFKSVDGRKSTILKETGKEIVKSCYSYLWGTRKDKYEYKHLERVARDLVPGSWQELFEKMEKIAEDVGKDAVRIVFWFDC